MLGYRFCLKQLGLPAWPLAREARPGQAVSDRDVARLEALHPQLLSPGEGDGAIPTHLEFALRHEGVDLAAMAAVCAAMDPRQLASWINARPSSKYARKAGFLYEWLTGIELPVDATRIAGGYEPVLEPDLYFAGPITNISRWHVRNNLPGTPDWCPIIHRSRADGTAVGTFDVPAAISRARAPLPRQIIAQALAVAQLAEVRSSHLLAGEEAGPAQETALVRLLRTAGEVSVVERLSPTRLIQLQGALFAGTASHAAYGLRRDDRFLGGAGSEGYQRVEFPCPPARALHPLLRGLSSAGEQLAQTAPPTVLAGVMSFGFGFLHPLLAGNGRVQRYLIHAALAAARAVRGGAVIPVSEVMLARREEYEQVQRAYCAPVRVAAESLAGVPFVLEPGSEFSFPGYERVAPLYRYPVLTEQVAYLERVLAEAIASGFAEEAGLLAAQVPERRQLAARLGLPMARVDLLMRTIRRQGGTVSDAQRAQLGGVDAAVLSEVEAAARRAPHPHPRQKARSGRGAAGGEDPPPRRRSHPTPRRSLNQK